MANIARFRDPISGRFVSAAAAVIGQTLYEVINPTAGLVSREVFRAEPEPEAAPEVDLEPNWSLDSTARTKQWNNPEGINIDAALVTEPPLGARQFRVVYESDAASAGKNGLASTSWAKLPEMDALLTTLQDKDTTVVGIWFDVR